MADAAGAAGGAGPGARPPVDVEAVLLRCVALKEAGTALFKSTEDNASAKAITKWFELLALLTTVSREAIPGQEEGGLGALLGNGPTLSPAQAAQVQELRVSALLNTAVALFKRERWQSAEAHCTRALALEPNNIKALLRRGRARLQLRNSDGALEDLTRVETLEPGNADAARELRAVHELRRREDAAARGTFAKMFAKQS